VSSFDSHPSDGVAGVLRDDLVLGSSPSAPSGPEPEFCGEANETDIVFLARVSTVRLGFLPSALELFWSLIGMAKRPSSESSSESSAGGWPRACGAGFAKLTSLPIKSTLGPWLFLLDNLDPGLPSMDRRVATGCERTLLAGVIGLGAFAVDCPMAPIFLPMPM